MYHAHKMLTVSRYLLNTTVAHFVTINVESRVHIHLFISRQHSRQPHGACVSDHSTKKPVTTMLTYPWKCTVLHCNHLGNTWKPLVLMTRHFDYCPSASEGDNQSVRSSAPVVSRCFPGGYNVKLYISRGRCTEVNETSIYKYHNEQHEYPRDK